MKPKTLLRTVALVAVMMLTALPAVALEDDGGTDTDQPRKTMSKVIDLVSFWFDPVENMLHIGLTGPDAEEPVVCEAPEEDPTTVTTVATDETDAESDCQAVDVTKADGTLNHGSLVSAVVHHLKENRDQLDGPFGQYVKIFAQLRLDDLTDADGDVDAAAVDDEDGKKDKKVKSEDSNGNGPPDHAPAHGRRNK